MDLQIAGRTGLVTGASSGIGRAIAHALAREGVRLTLAARRPDELEAAADEVVAAGGERPKLVDVDLLSPEATSEIVEAARNAHGPVDILVNNAGGSRPLPLGSDDQSWDEAMTLNFTRHRQLTERLVAGMGERGWGRVLNITGKSEPEGINGAFSAKAAMHSWAKGLSREVGPRGITVNSVPPGRISSEQIRRNYSPEYRQWQENTEIPVGRYGEPAEIANLICYLASPLADYITGTVIPVDGGLRRYQF